MALNLKRPTTTPSGGLLGNARVLAKSLETQTLNEQQMGTGRDYTRPVEQAPAIPVNEPTYESRRDTRLYQQDIAREQEKKVKETASERAKMLERQIADKYGIEVKRSFSPIQFTNMVMKIPADRREQFKKDYQEYTLEIERSNPFRAGAEAGFNVLPTQLESTEGKEAVTQAPNFNVGRFVGGAGQQLAFGSVLGAPIESAVGRVLPKATPFVTETIKDVAIGTGTQLIEAPFDKPTVGQFATNTALDIALNALFGVVGKSLSKVNAMDLKNAKTPEIVENVAKDMNVTPKEASDMIDKSIDNLMQMRTQTPRVEPMLAPRAEMRTDTTAINLRQPETPINKIDENGITLYHGTWRKHKGFEPGRDFYFTPDKEFAESFIREPKPGTDLGGELLEGKIKSNAKILDTRTAEGKKIADEIISADEYMNYRGVDSYKESKFENGLPKFTADDFISEVKNKGYDGVVLAETLGKEGTTSFRLFNPDAIEVKAPQQTIERPSEFTVRPKKLTEKLAEDVGIESDRINVPLPRQPEARAPRQTTPEGLKFRQTIENSFMKSEMPEESKQIFDEIPEVYEQVRNQDVWDRAFENVIRNVDDAINRFESKLSLESADDTAEAIAIMNRLADVNDISTLDRVARTMAERATRAGQAIQAIVMLQRTTPEGKLVQAHNVIKNITDKMKEETPALYDKLLKEGKLPELSPDDSKFIVETMKKAQDLTGRAKAIEIAKVDQLLANKIPSTFGDKFRALINLSLLGNFKTIATRNPLGNVIFSGLENISQIPSGLTDKMLSAWLKTPRTTKAVPDLLTQGKGFKKGLIEALEDIKLNVDTSPTRGGAELPRNREVFKKSVLAAVNDMLGNPVKLAKFLEVSWLNKANNWLGDALKLGDRPFYQAAYEARLKELKELQPNADIKDLEKLAQDFGLDRVFQNQGATAEALSMVKRGMNKLNIKGVGLGDIVMPYTQTPANILAKGAQYTPLNLINMGKIALGSGQGSVKKNIANNQKAFSDAVGRLFTGTGLIALGWTLAKNGYVTGRQTDTSKKAKELKRNVGEQQYSIKIGDTWYSYDWAQPASVPLAVGIDAYNAGANETDLLSMIEKATISGGQTLVEQGMLQNLTRLFGGYSPVENVIETIVTSPTQLSPTLGSQLAQATDPFKRDVDYSSAGTQLMTTLQKKNPLLRQSLPATLDIWGQPAVEQQGKGSVQKALDTFINPSLVSKQTEDKTTLEIYRLFTETKDTDVIPSYTPSALKTPNEIRNFKEIYGELAKRKVESIMNSSKYKGSSDKTKAELIADALEDVRTSAKDQYNKKYKTDL